MTGPNTPAVAGAASTPAAPADAAEPQESKTKLAVGMLPDDVKHALILARQKNIVTAEIASTNWGKGLDPDTRMRISEWSRAAGIDAATELDVLGGRFYKNAAYYLRKLSEMIEAQIVEYAYIDHVESDARLDTMAKRGDAAGNVAFVERDRRLMMRLQYAIPDAALGASVAHVKLWSVPVEFTAAKWCGGGTRKSDPVGDSFPVETSETRAFRRVLRLVASQNPQFKSIVEPNDDDAIDAQIGDDLRAGLATAKAQQAVSIVPRPLMALGAGRSGYESPDSAPTNTATLASVASIAASSAGKEPDPYADAPKAAAAPASVDQNDLDLMSAAEREEYEARKRSGGK